MSELERELRSLAIEWPETPALTPVLGRQRSRRPLVLALAALLVALAVALAVPPARSAILRFLHLRGETIEFVGTLPAAQERSLTAGLGRELPLAEAEARAGFTALLPAHARVHHAFARPGVLAIRLGKGRLLSELSGVGLDVQKKLLPGATRLQAVEVGGEPGLWIEGGPHVLVFLGPGGVIETRTLRLAGNVLVWEHGALTLRLEGPLTLAEALRVAGAVR